MKFTNMQHIPLVSAYLCPDCNCIGNCASQCPACASPVLLALANVLNREPARAPVLEYAHNFNRYPRRRTFIVNAKARGIRSKAVSAPTPITINAGALPGAHTPWRVVDEAANGIGEAS
jgi:hypothetical protein